MNLHGIASRAVSSINPMISGTLYQSAGYVTLPGGRRLPQYNLQTGSLQVQGLSESALRHMNELNIGGVLRKFYLTGAWASIVRADAKGGDLATFMDQGTLRTWMFVHVLEQWPDWCAVIAQMQVDPVIVPTLYIFPEPSGAIFNAGSEYPGSPAYTIIAHAPRLYLAADPTYLSQVTSATLTVAGPDSTGIYSFPLVVGAIDLQMFWQVDTLGTYPWNHPANGNFTFLNKGTDGTLVIILKPGSYTYTGTVYSGADVLLTTSTIRTFTEEEVDDLGFPTGGSVIGDYPTAFPTHYIGDVAAGDFI